MIAAAGGRETVGARFLVGTDGGRSAVRHLLGIDFPGKTLGIRAVVADLDLSGLGDDAWHRWNEGTPDQISLCPLRGNRHVPAAGAGAFEGDIAVSVEGLGAMIRERAGADRHRRSRRALGFGLHHERAAGGPLSRRPRPARRRCGAHPSADGRPGSQYQCPGLLQSRLEAGGRAARRAGTLLASYEAERRPVAAEVLGLSTKLLDAALARSGQAPRARNATNSISATRILRCR